MEMETLGLSSHETGPIIERRLSADYEIIRKAAIKMLEKEIEEIKNPKEAVSQEVADVKEERIKNVQKVIDRLTDAFVLGVAETKDGEGETWQTLRDESMDLKETDERTLPEKLVRAARMAI